MQNSAARCQNNDNDACPAWRHNSSSKAKCRAGTKSIREFRKRPELLRHHYIQLGCKSAGVAQVAVSRTGDMAQLASAEQVRARTCKPTRSCRAWARPPRQLKLGKQAIPTSDEVTVSHRERYNETILHSITYYCHFDQGRKQCRGRGLHYFFACPLALCILTQRTS